MSAAPGDLLQLPRALLRRAALVWPGRSMSRVVPDDSGGNDDLGPAFERFADGEWAAAFHTLTRLADLGNRDASRIALMMEARGPRLFGQSFVVGRAQRQRWTSETAVPGAHN